MNKLNIKEVLVKLTRSEKDWILVNMFLDFSERTEPKKTCFRYDDGDREHFISVHEWKRLDGKKESYNDLADEAYENGLNKHLFN